MTAKGDRHTPEAIARMRKAHTGRTPSAETRVKISAAKLGKVRGPHTAEARAKISAAMKNRTQSAETRAKKRASALGRSVTNQTKAKISASLIGRKWSDERKAAALDRRRGSMSPEAYADYLLYRRKAYSAAEARAIVLGQST